MKSEFVWDLAKDAGNLRKHGINFETASLVFADPHALMDQDRIEDGEQRWQAIGSIGGYHILLVAYTTWDEDEDGNLIEIIRIISARKATREERQRYEQQAR